MEREIRCTVVQRSMRATMAFGAAAVALLAGALALPAATESPLAWAAGAVAAVLGLLFAVGAIYAAWRAPCPDCGRAVPVSQPDAGRGRCGGCGRSLEVRARRARCR
jgi:hypothetical protein